MVENNAAISPSWVAPSRVIILRGKLSFETNNKTVRLGRGKKLKITKSPCAGLCGTVRRRRSRRVARGATGPAPPLSQALRTQLLASTFSAGRRGPHSARSVGLAGSKMLHMVEAYQLDLVILDSIKWPHSFTFSLSICPEFSTFASSQR